MTHRRKRRRRWRRPIAVPRAAADFVWQLKIENFKKLYSFFLTAHVLSFFF